MPTAKVNNPDADFTKPRSVNRTTGRGQRPSKSQGTAFGGQFYGINVNETLDVRYKKKRLPRGRRASRGRSALTIQLDSEKPLPKF